MFDCPVCGTKMREETSHFHCLSCNYIEPCCDGAPGPATHVPPMPDALLFNMVRRIQEDLCVPCSPISYERWPDALCVPCQDVATREHWINIGSAVPE